MTCRFPGGSRVSLRTWALALLALACLAPVPAQGQEEEATPLRRLWLEGSVGVAVPTQDFGNVDPTCPDNNPDPCPFPAQIGATTGVGFAARGGVRLDPATSLFLGYERNYFQCSTFFCGNARPPLSTSYDLGVQRDVVAAGTLRFWVEGAVSWERVNVVRIGMSGPNTNLELNERVAYDGALAASVGVGLRLGLRGNNLWEFTPAARYRFSRAEPGALHGDLSALDVTHFHLDLAFRRNYR